MATRKYRQQQQCRTNEAEIWKAGKVMTFDVFSRVYPKNPSVRYEEHCTVRWRHTWLDWPGSDLCRTFHSLGLHRSNTGDLNSKRTQKKEIELHSVLFVECCPTVSFSICSGKWLYYTRNSWMFWPWATVTLSNRSSLVNILIANT